MKIGELRKIAKLAEIATEKALYARGGGELILPRKSTYYHIW